MDNLAAQAMGSGFLLNKAGRLIVVTALLFMAFFVIAPVHFKSFLYLGFREMAKMKMTWQTRHWNELIGPNFIIRYTVHDKETASMVLDVAEKDFGPLTEDFKYVPNKKILIVVYPTKESLGRSFGWSADESAMGVYWAGVIRVLSPTAWIDENNHESFVETFQNEGPIAHELSHLIVDYMTGGNYTRWFTEGIAQYQESKVTGYPIQQRKIGHPGELYPFSRMDSEFDNLSDQSMAYFQSYLAVVYMVELYGEKGLSDTLTNLGNGFSLDRSFRLALGVSVEDFEKDFRIWALHLKDRA